jgi:hypothetical protein
MVAFTLGPEVSDHFESPGTRAKGVAMLRAELVEAQDYARKRREDAERTSARPRPQARGRWGGCSPASCRRSSPPTAPPRSWRRCGWQRGVRLPAGARRRRRELPGARRDPRRRRAGDPPPADGAAGRRPRQRRFETAAKLAEAGIPFALQSGFEGYVPKTRVLLFEAATAAANGLTFEQALAPSPATRPRSWASTTGWGRSRRARTATWCSSTAIRSSSPPTSAWWRSAAGWCRRSAGSGAAVRTGPVLS